MPHAQPDAGGHGSSVPVVMASRIRDLEREQRRQGTALLLVGGISIVSMVFAVGTLLYTVCAQQSPTPPQTPTEGL